METALITGASGGIGLELAYIFAGNNIHLILVARSLDKLQKIAADITERYKVNVTVLSKDLSVLSEAESLVNEVAPVQIDYLVNNAGFGVFGKTTETPWNKELQMLNLNMVTLAYLAKTYATQMVDRKKGRILNVASTAAFQPGPMMSAYSATKAFVLSLTEGMSEELRGSGVTLTALCPGATESGFQEAAAMHESRLFKNRKLPSSKQVAEFGYRAMMKGKVVAVHGIKNNILAFGTRIFPRWAVRRITRYIIDK
ncbi:MAG TPA: SDR family oxidoreductase [Bacteroidia bacterium]|nr:SDR family oxidoreductase [Bacteroidia bacterium]